MFLGFLASPAGFEPTAFRLGAHEACGKKARNIGKNVYYEKSVCATYAVDAAYAAYAGKSVVKSVPKLCLLRKPLQRTLHPNLKMPAESYKYSSYRQVNVPGSEVYSVRCFRRSQA